MREHLQRHGRGYLVAMAATAAIVLLRGLTDPLLIVYLPLGALYGAVLVAVWFGGIWPALLAAILNYLSCELLLPEPVGIAALHDVHVPLGLVRYCISCAIIITLGEALHNARRRADRERESIRVTLASIGDAVLTANTAGRVTSLNPMAETLTGWTNEEAVGHPIGEVFFLRNENTLQESQDSVARVLAQGMVIGLPKHTVLVTKQSDERPIDASAAPIRDRTGRVTGLVLVFRDVSMRKQEEEENHRLNHELSRRVAEMQAILNVVPIGISIALDPECRRITHNPYMSEVLGVQVWKSTSLSAPPGARAGGYVVRRNGRELAPEEMPMQVACTGEEVKDLEIEVARRGVPSRKLLCYVRPLRDAAGRMRGSVGAFVDITERRRMEDALRDADRRKDEFLATLAHELRNPLAPLRNAVELLRRADDDSAVREEVRSIMERQLAQLVRLVDDLLDISRITTGKLRLRQSLVPLGDVVQSAIETSRPLIETAGQTLSVSVPQEAIVVDADPARLAQMISNLLNNASKYTEKDGQIRLTVERQDGTVIIKVRDNGVGIAAEHLPRIFDMFSQVAPIIERSQGGLGIGLALVRGLVELHGGTIEAHSDGIGQGSEFIIRLPLADISRERLARRASLGPLTPSRTLATNRDRFKILVVDDNRDTANSLAMMLRTMGHVVLTAYDGEEALEAASKFQPAVILLDIGLPKLNGYEVARRLRAEPGGASLMLIAITGWGQDEDRRRSKEAGFDRHLVKPVEISALQSALNSLRAVSV